MIRTLVLCTLMAAASSAVDAKAASIFYEPFDYSSVRSDGDPLATFGTPPSGSGWTSAWNASADVLFESTGLTHANSLTPIGGAGEAVTNDAANNRTFSTAGLTDDGDVQYVSFLMNFGGVVPNAGADRFLFFSNGSSNGQGVEFGNSGGDGTIATRITNTVGGSTISFDENTTHLVVMRLAWSDTGGADQLDIWLDPTVVGGGIGASDLSSTGDFGTAGQFYLRNQNDNYVVDEIRMGELLSDVMFLPEPATAPEPSTFVLASLSMLGFAAVRRRRR